MPQQKRPSTGEDQMIYKTALYLLAALAILVCFIPVLLGYGVFVLLRQHLRRLHYAIITASALLAVALSRSALPEYFSFLFKLFTSHRFISLAVVVEILCLSVLVVGVVGLFQGTAIAARIPSFLSPRTLGEKPTIIPTAREKQQLSEIVLPSPAASGAMANSMVSDTRPGERLVVLGVDRDGAPIGVSEREIGTHALIFGSTGSGKTEAIKTLAGGLLDLGWQGIILDLKEDTKPGGLRDWCETYSHSHAIAYQELRLSDARPAFWFDALAGLSQDEARDTILSLTRFDDEYYKNICIRVLGQLLKLRFWANEVDPANCPLPTLYDVAMTLSAPSLSASTKKWRAIVSQAMPDLPKGEFQVLESPSQVEQQQAASWGAKLGNLYETQAGRLVLRAPAPTEHRPRVDVTANGLIYIGLDSQGKPDLTKIVSSSVLQRISVEAAQRTTGTSTSRVQPKFLIVDEANWVDRTIVQNLLSRARSAGIAMVLCTQGPKDWIDKDGNDFARLAQNTNVAMIMKQGEPEAAEICADYIGTVDYQKFTQRIEDGSFSGGGSLMDRTEHIVSPNDLRSLGTGEMIIRASTPRVRTEWLRVIMRDPRLHHGGPSEPPSPRQNSRRSQDGSSPRSHMRPPSAGPGSPGLARPPIQ